MAQAMARYRDHPLVEFIEPDYLYRSQEIPDDPGFDSNNTDATALTATLEGAWNAAKADYEAKLTDLLDKQSQRFERQLALAAAEADAAARGERRLLDAAQQVADRQATL